MGEALKFVRIIGPSLYEEFLRLKVERLIFVDTVQGFK